MPNPKWPKTWEDKLLDAYWRQRGSGTLYTEVRLGKDAWKAPPTQGGDSGKFRLDAVIAESSALDGPFNHKAFRNAVEGNEVRTCEVVEVKPGLSEWVIGQALVGRCLFEAQTEGLTMVGRTTVVSRHIDPAMRWVAQKLDLHVAQPLQAEKPKLMRSRPHYALKDRQLRRLAAWRKQTGGAGLMLTRVPLAGPRSGVPAWEGSAPTWVRFVHVPSHAAAPGTVVYDPEHASILREAPELELVLVTRHVPGRAGLGLLASQALMFEAQYGRPFTSCLVICGERDPAIAHAYETIPRKHGLPPIRVAEVGKLDDDDDAEEDMEDMEDSQ
jgi:hypothetical protein